MAQAFLALNIGGKLQSFPTQKKFIDWVDAHKEVWTEVAATSELARGNLEETAVMRFLDGLQEFLNATETLREPEPTAALVQKLAESVPFAALPLAQGHAEWDLIAPAAKENHGLFLLAFLLETEPKKLWSLAQAYSLEPAYIQANGLHTHYQAAAAANTASLLAELRTEYTQAKQRLQTDAAEHHSELTKAKEQLQALQTSQTALVEAAASLNTAQATDFAQRRAGFDSMVAAFEINLQEKLRLGTAHSFWDAHAASLGKKATRIGWFLVGFLILSTVAAAYSATKLIGVAPMTLLGGIAGLLAATTIVLGLATYLWKLYFHLTTRQQTAQERALRIQTYLALHAMDGELTRKERELMLASIFSNYPA